MQTKPKGGKVHLYDSKASAIATRKLPPGVVADLAACGERPAYTMTFHEIGRGNITCPACLQEFAKNPGHFR